jgi:nucleoid-associated protein YgaU
MEVLRNKSYTDSGRLSRYTPFPYYYHTKDDKYISGVTSYLKDTTVYTSYDVQRGDTFDSIALEFYNNPTLYWIICSFNRIQDPFTELVEGQVLKIPSISNIEFDI